MLRGWSGMGSPARSDTPTYSSPSRTQADIRAGSLPSGPKAAAVTASSPRSPSSGSVHVLRKTPGRSSFGAENSPSGALTSTCAPGRGRRRRPSPPRPLPPWSPGGPPSRQRQRQPSPPAPGPAGAPDPRASSGPLEARRPGCCSGVAGSPRGARVDPLEQAALGALGPAQRAVARRRGDASLRHEPAQSHHSPRTAAARERPHRRAAASG